MQRYIGRYLFVFLIRGVEEGEYERMAPLLEIKCRQKGVKWLILIDYFRVGGQGERPLQEQVHVLGQICGHSLRILQGLEKRDFGT